MMDFEQQIAEALDEILKAGSENNINFNAVSRGRYLAPHVAAAIEAAHSDHGCVPIEESICGDKALAALRGEGSGT